MNDIDNNRPGYGYAEYCFLGLVLISFVSASAVASRFKPFWYDELIGHILITSPSTLYMLEALGHKVDSLPPLYFLVARIWTTFFGASELSLRLLTSLGFAGAFIVTWRVGRKYFSVWAISFGAAAAFCLCETLVNQIAEARCYGIFVFLCSLCLRQCDKFLSNRNASRIDTALNAILHACLVLTHVFGFIYSAVFQLAIFAADIRERRFRPVVYASGFLGWLLYLPWLPSFLRQADLGNPHSWMPVPTFLDLRRSFSNSISFGFVLAMLAIVVVIRLYRPELNKNPRPVNGITNAASPIIVSTVLVLVPPLAAWAESRVATPIFLDRYFLPGVLGWTILLSMIVQFVTDWIGRSSEVARETRFELVAAWGPVLFMAVLPVLFAVHRSQLRAFEINPIGAQYDLYNGPHKLDRGLRLRSLPWRCRTPGG